LVAVAVARGGSHVLQLKVSSAKINNVFVTAARATAAILT
jgi:hypothetical protein